MSTDDSHRFEELPDEAVASTTASDSDSDDFHEAAEDELAQAEILKTDANREYAAKRYDNAIAIYKEALAYLPPRPKLVQPPADDQVKGKGRADLSERAEQGLDEEEEDEEKPVLPAEDSKVKTLRAALWCNMAAAEIQCERWKEAAVACSEAIQDDPDYVKALHRRAIANEKIETWTSLTTALEDWKKLQTLAGSDMTLLNSAKVAERRLPPRIDVKKADETKEMMDKLKGMGNSLLGKFGLSTDNFQFTPNGEGGYSMNFNR